MHLHVKCIAKIDQNIMLAAVIRHFMISHMAWLVNQGGIAGLFPHGLCRHKVKVARALTGRVGSFAASKSPCLLLFAKYTRSRISNFLSILVQE